MFLSLSRSALANECLSNDDMLDFFDQARWSWSCECMFDDRTSWDEISARAAGYDTNAGNLFLGPLGEPLTNLSSFVGSGFGSQRDSAGDVGPDAAVGERGTRGGGGSPGGSEGEDGGGTQRPLLEEDLTEV